MSPTIHTEGDSTSQWTQLTGIGLVQPTINTHLIFEIPYTNLADQEWVALWSPYSNCCFYPVPMDSMTNTGHSLIFFHDMHMPTNFGYWKFEKKAQ